MQESPDKHEQFVRLFTLHDMATKAYVRSGVHSWDDVNEIMQEVAIVAWRKFAELEDHSRFGKWLTLIARFEVLAFYRRKARDRHVLSEELVAQILDEDEIRLDESQERQRVMQDCFNSLPKRHRELLTQIHGSGLSVIEVAARLGKSQAAIYQIVSRLRRSLNDCLRSKFIAEGI